VTLLPAPGERKAPGALNEWAGWKRQVPAPPCTVRTMRYWEGD